MAAKLLLVSAAACFVDVARAETMGAGDLGVSESLIAELEKELRRDATVLEEWDPLYQLRRLAEGSYSYVDDMDAQFSFAFSYSYSFSFPELETFSYSYSMTPAPTISPIPTSHPTLDCADVEGSHMKFFFGPEDSNYDKFEVEIAFRTSDTDDYETLAELTDVAYYTPMCLPYDGCYKIVSKFSGENPAVEGMFFRAMTNVDSVTNMFDTSGRLITVYNFCVSEFGNLDRAPTQAPTTMAPTAEPTANPTSSKPSSAPTMTESVWTVEFITDVTAWGFSSSNIAAYAYNGFCISDAYDVVVHAETTTAWSSESITLTYLATDCIASSYISADPATTQISMTCAISMYNNEAAPRDHETLNTAVAAGDYMNSEFASLAAADGGATFNSAVIAAINLDACPTVISTFAGIEADDPDFFDSARRRRLLDISLDELLGIVEENQEAAQVDEVVVTAATWMPTSSPTEAPSPLPTQREPTQSPAPVPTGTPSMIPTCEETASPSAKPITTPTAPPTYAVCTADSDCPVGTVCCVEEHTRRRHLAFGNTYGLCKPAC